MNEQDSFGEKNFSRAQKRKAEFISLPNYLKARVGEGGLSDEILDRAEKIIQDNNYDFCPVGENYLETMLKAVQEAEKAGKQDDPERLIYAIIYPAMQLKANGAMFHYPLVTEVADRLIQYLEVIDHPDEDVLEIVMAFYQTIHLILQEELSGPGGVRGTELKQALVEACERYFRKHPDNFQEQH